MLFDVLVRMKATVKCQTFTIIVIKRWENTIREYKTYILESSFDYDLVFSNKKIWEVNLVFYKY